MRTLDFTDHRRDLNDNRYVYAVVSRRSRGLSIGINLNPDTICNFACPYCQVPREGVAVPHTVDVERLGDELDHLLGIVASGELWSLPPFNTAAPALRRVNDIAMAGDGEPTSCRSFTQVVRRIGESRLKYGLSDVDLLLLSNATLFHRPRVWEGLEALGELGGRVWAKLDAGSPEWFRVIAGTALPFQRVLDNLLLAARRWPITVQSMFVSWEGAPVPETEIAAWAGRLSDILEGGGSLAEVQVYTVARAPADARVGALDAEQLERIGGRVHALGVPVRVVRPA